MALSLPRGTSDFGPADAIRLNAMRDAVEDTFRRFGFYPIKTPAIELMGTLNAKAYGEDSKKEIYVLEGAEEGMRYDFTVPLARYIAMNKDLQFPFKRYQIGDIWRRDEPQKMRKREFLQADIDVIGSADVSSDAEIIAAACLSVERLGVDDYTVLINSRVFLDSILSMFKMPQERRTSLIRCIDKLGKIGSTGAAAQMEAQGVDMKDAQAILQFITMQRGDDAALFDELKTAIPDAKSEIERMARLLELLKGYGIRGKAKIDLSLARGLDYYTGGIWEIIAAENGKRLPTLAAGGRYDRLIGMYSKRDVPAVGMSIGLSRVFELLEGPEEAKTYARVYIASIRKEDVPYAISVATRLRSSGICADMNLTERGIAKQMEYANALRIPHVAIIGGIERQANMVKLRNMATGEEKLVTLDDCINELKMV